MLPKVDTLLVDGELLGHPVDILMPHWTHSNLSQSHTGLESGVLRQWYLWSCHCFPLRHHHLRTQASLHRRRSRGSQAGDPERQQGETSGPRGWGEDSCVESHAGATSYYAVYSRFYPTHRWVHLLFKLCLFKIANLLMHQFPFEHWS